MRVWLFDTRLQRSVAALLMPMTDEHVARIIDSWVPEFHRRQEVGERDQDYLMWETGLTYVELLARRANAAAHVIVQSSYVQGVLVLEDSPVRSRVHAQEPVRIVNYLATAPWNRGGRSIPGNYRRTGTILLGHAVMNSMATGCMGRLGLHSLTDSDEFYRKLGFDDWGPNPAERGLRYFELSVAGAARLLCATIYSGASTPLVPPPNSTP